MTDLLVILAVGLGTYLMRASFLALAGPQRVPDSLVRLLDHAKHAVLAALAVGFVAGGSTSSPVALAGLGSAALAARFLRHPLAPLAVGIGAAFVVTWVV